MLLYLHIPFCHRICPYCSFYKHTPGATPIPRFIDAVAAEARHHLAGGPHPAPRSLYLGGGTPSMLSPAHLRRLFEGLGEIVDLASLDEITLEANPATFDLRKAELFRELGITRVSLGIQSFDAATLATLGREHSPAEAAEAVRILRRAGLPSINIDLIFSVPGLSLATWKETLETAISLKPDHLSAYNLTYEEDTAFFESLRRGEMNADEDRDADQFFLAHDLLTAAGFEHYETSNYARPGHRSSHNHGYLAGEPYLGLGPSAVSTLPDPAHPGRSLRHRNAADTDRYVRMVESLGHAREETETLGPEDLRLERLALLLRTSEGAPLDLADRAALEPLVGNELVTIRDERIVLTRAGSALVDPIAASLA